MILSRNARHCHVRITPSFLQPLQERKCDAGSRNDLVSLGATGALGDTGLEAVSEAAVDNAQRAHTAAAGGLAALGLLTPVDYHRMSA